MKIKFQRLHGGNETNYENKKKIGQFLGTILRLLHKKIPPVEEKIRQSSILLFKSSDLID